MATAPNTSHFTLVDDGGEADAQVVATLNHGAINRAREVADYNMTVTFEVGISAEEIYPTYHNL